MWPLLVCRINWPRVGESHHLLAAGHLPKGCVEEVAGVRDGLVGGEPEPGPRPGH